MSANMIQPFKNVLPLGHTSLLAGDFVIRRRTNNDAGNFRKQFNLNDIKKQHLSAMQMLPGNLIIDIYNNRTSPIGAASTIISKATNQAHFLLNENKKAYGNNVFTSDQEKRFLANIKSDYINAARDKLNKYADKEGFTYLREVPRKFKNSIAERILGKLDQLSK